MRVSFLVIAVLVFSIGMYGAQTMLGDLVSEYQPVTGVGQPNTTFFSDYETFNLENNSKNKAEELFEDSENSVNNPNIADQFGFIASASRVVGGVTSSAGDAKNIIVTSGSQLGIPPRIVALLGALLVIIFVFAVASAIFKWRL